jgi:RimJ/RimL family protein N-acetyltransferase
MGLTLKCPSLADVEQVRRWRNTTPEVYRTPYLITAEQQEAFYRNIVCDRRANSRWWSVYDGETLVGFAGLTDIEWENGLAQVSLVTFPRGKGYGTRAFALLLDEGFGNLGLSTLYGECYECNPALGFWERMIDKYGGYKTTIPRRKRWQGQLYDAMHFCFWR